MSKAIQTPKFSTGNEMIAEAARAIDFHFMGYYPITPSTEIAELIDEMKAQGDVSTVMLAADGEHGAAGACFGAATTGARVLNATSANGFLYSMEQLPAQAGSRLPMVLNLVTRSVSGPLDIRCDHSDLMYALQTGWIVLLAATPQAAYDLNIIAVKLGEHPLVRLPVIVASDGFFTSHQRQSCQIFANKEDVQNFIGPRKKNFFTTIDPRSPVTVGPYMNDPDLINNKYQLHKAHENALIVYEQIADEYFQLTGRSYPALEKYGSDSSKTALFILNSAAETAKDAVDSLQKDGEASVVLRPNILRPFPFEQLKKATHSLLSVVIAERSDSPGSMGGVLSHEVKAVLFADHHCQMSAASRTYGLGGRDFTEEDAKDLIRLGAKLASHPESEKAFDFIGVRDGVAKELPSEVLPPLDPEKLSLPLVTLQQTQDSGTKVKVRAISQDPSQLVLRPKRIAAGHGACPGCGIFSGLDQFFKGIQGDVVVLYHTGCAMVVTTDYPFSAHRISYIHNLFQNGAPTLAGVVESFHELRRRKEISVSEDVTFVMITGDGGMDIGMGPTIGTALRNHRMIILEYDNQGYMNTGGQLSYTTPFGSETTTSNVGQIGFGKSFHHKDTLSIMAATGIPYVFSAIEGFGTDLVEKAAKAQWFAKNKGLAFGKILVSCPLNWGSEERMGLEVLQRAVDSCFFPIYEIQESLTSLSYDPEANGKKIEVSDWLKMMKKSKHLLQPENREHLSRLQKEVDARWQRLKARAQHPLL